MFTLGNMYATRITEFIGLTQFCLFAGEQAFHVIHQPTYSFGELLNPPFNILIGYEGEIYV